MRAVVIQQAWRQFSDNDDHILFGARKTAVDISTLHPESVQIFRLWQLYLDNVDPLLKVTHTPTLQGRIIEAASNISNIKPSLEALMFRYVRKSPRKSVSRGHLEHKSPVL